jgi:hypothetical protein
VTAKFDQARGVADAVLYEGYLLYPYRASSAKNRSRWQFGVLVPPSFASDDVGEHSTTLTECVLDGAQRGSVHVRLRFLQVQQREVRDWTGCAVECLRVGGEEYLPWQEAVEHEREVVVSVGDLLDGEQEFPVVVEGGELVDELPDHNGRVQGTVVRQRRQLFGVVRLSARVIPGPYGGIHLRVEVANATGREDGDDTRESALRSSFVAVHLLLGVTEGAFLSLLDPPEWAKSAIEGCANVRTWPVLIGATDRSDTVLSAPIILYDDPEIAPESQHALYDSTEIDEILTLRSAARGALVGPGCGLLGLARVRYRPHRRV